MQRLTIKHSLALALFYSLADAAWAAEEPVIAVIVSAITANSPTVTAPDLSSIYWRKTLYNANGKPLRPVNLFAEHPLRVRFSQQVLHSLPISQLNYWNGLYFNGVQPPFTVQSEEAMLRYVADTENAIGYVDACHVDARVKAILWVHASKVISEPPAMRCDN